MKFCCVILASVLFVSAGVNGERCKVVHATTSSLKCRDKVISRDAAMMAAYNECTTEGNDFKLDDMLCVMAKLGAVTNGWVSPSQLDKLLAPTFEEHSPALVAGLVKCEEGRAAADAAHDQYGPIECTSKVYEDVCGHKSCNWINNI